MRPKYANKPETVPGIDLWGQRKSLGSEHDQTDAAGTGRYPSTMRFISSHCKLRRGAVSARLISIFNEGRVSSRLTYAGYDTRGTSSAPQVNYLILVNYLIVVIVYTDPYL